MVITDKSRDTIGHEENIIGFIYVGILKVSYDIKSSPNTIGNLTWTSFGGKDRSK
jgi:hypothetical protein